MRKGVIFRILWVFIIVLLSLVVLETGLRQLLSNKPFLFTLHKKLKFYNTFIVDQNNVFRHNLDNLTSLKSAKQQIKNNKTRFIKKIGQTKNIFKKYIGINQLGKVTNSRNDNEVESLLEKTIHNELFGVPEPLLEDLNKSIEQGGFAGFTKKLKAEYSEPNAKQVDQDVRSFIQNPVNDEGFRSLPFRNHNTKRKKVLLLGDSFAYGFSAMPFHNSFANRLLQEGFVVYNCGIPGANVINYNDAAKEYIDQINPDYVFVLFYLKNDIIHDPLDSNMTGYKPFHATNFTWFKTTIKGNYTPDTNQYQKRFLDCVYNEWDGFLTKNSLLYSVLHKELSSTDLNECVESITSRNRNFTGTNYYLTNIKQLSKKAGASFFVTIIPDQDNWNVQEYVQKRKHDLFRNINVNWPNTLSKSDFRFDSGDPHFNNRGHLKMKKFLEELLSSETEKTK